MRVLMISLDRGLLRRAGSSGDVLARHQKYADLAGHLDIIVFASKSFQKKEWSKNLRVFPTGSNQFSHFRAAEDLAIKLCREHDYDLLVTQEFAAPAGARIKKRCGLPWLVNIHSMFFSSDWLGWSLKNWLLLYLIRGAIVPADGFRVTNKVIEKKLKHWGLPAPVLVQPTPVEVEKFLGLEKEKHVTPVVLYAGRLSSEKNVGLLVRAARGIEGDFKLRIAGQGPEEAALQKLAAGDSRIEFLGAKSHVELAGIYAGADIVVLPSNTESFGKVLIEGGAAGCSLLATRTAGAQSIIKQDENGILVNIGDEKALRQALERLLADSSLRQRLASAARDMAREYSSGQATDNLINFWKKIAKVV